MDGNGFGWALEELFLGHRVRRQGWNGKGMWVMLQRPDSGSKMTRPYLYLKDVHDTLGPWLPSQTDLLSFDWELAD